MLRVAEECWCKAIARDRVSEVCREKYLADQTTALGGQSHTRPCEPVDNVNVGITLIVRAAELEQLAASAKHQL